MPKSEPIAQWEGLSRARLLDLGRASFSRREWRDALEALGRADDEEPLDAFELENLADAAYLSGADDQFFLHLERAYRQHVESGNPKRAALCALWCGLHGAFRGEMGRAGGWFGRAGNLLEDLGPCAERGYLLLPRIHQEMATGKPEAATATADEARRVGEEHQDPHLVAIATHLLGRALIEAGRVSDGLAALDETMLAVLDDDLPPRITGLIYCSVIEACQQVHAVDRAAEWTRSLRGWCDAQPTMLAFTGKCLIHRAEVFQLHGQWDEAIVEAREACARIARGPKGDSAGAALYQEAEIQRMRGELSAAEETYKRAGAAGTDPQPGLALLRLAQGEIKGAAASIRRVLDGSRTAIDRSRILPAFIEIMLAAGSADDARAAADELSIIASDFATPMLQAQASLCRGCVELASGEANAALHPSGEALRSWQRAGVPYQVAQTHRWLARACAAAGDDDGRQSHADSARAGLERLGSSMDFVDTRAAAKPAGTTPHHGLSPRELEVLRLVASGRTNREIAAKLSLSVKTIDRHVSNLLAKLRVASRAAATAYAYENDLL